MPDQERLTGTGLALLPGGLLFLTLLPFVGTSRYNNDEFTLMSLALRVAQGQVPHRDFFEFVGPVSILLLSAVYKVLGASLLTTHILMVAFIWVAAWQAARICRRLGVGPHGSWLAGFVVVFGAFIHWPVYSHHWVAQVPALAAIEFALIGLAGPALWPWFAAGVMTGLTGLTVQTDGAALGLALTAGLTLETVMRRRDGVAVSRGLALVAGVGLVLAVAAGVLASLGALAAAWSDMVLWPLAHYKQVGNPNDTAFGTDLPGLLSPVTLLPAWYARAGHTLFAYALATMPLIALSAWGAIAIRRRMQGHRWSAADGGLMVVGAWAAFTVAVLTRGSADYVHMSFGLAPAAVVATVGAARLTSTFATSATPWVRWVPFGLLVAYAASGFLMVANAVRKEPEVWNRPLSPDARVSEAPVMRFLTAEARPGDLMAALPSGGYFYFYGPRPAVRHELMLEPGVRYNSAEEFDAYWKEVATTRPRFVVIGTSPAGPTTRTLALYTSRLPNGYRHVGAFASPQFGPTWPAHVYQLD